MSRKLVSLLAFALTFAVAAAAQAQHHGHQHQHHHQHQPSSCETSRAGLYSYGYAYKPFVSYEESVLRGMAYYSAAQAQANVLNAQARQRQIENELLEVRNRNAKGAAIAEGKASA